MPEEKLPEENQLINPELVPEPPEKFGVSMWFVLFRDPGQFALDLWVAFDTWMTSRDWKRMLWFLPAFILLTICGSAIVWGSFRSKEDLLKYYLALAEREVPIEVKEPEAATKAKSEEAERAEAARNQLSELIYRRILQLDSGNRMARFYVAYRMSLSGNLTQARSLIRELAPDREAGYPPAHAWIVLDMPVRAQSGEKIEPSVFAHHVERAATWDKCPPHILQLRAGLLEEAKDVDGAITVLRRLLSEHPEARIAIADVCRRNGREGQAKIEIDHAIHFYNDRVGTIRETDQDRVYLAQAYLFINDWKEAKEVLATGLDQNPNRPILRRALANIFVQEYRSSIKETSKGVEANTDLLNTASQLDPSNPSVNQEVMQLVNAGAKTDQGLIEKLTAQMATGKATAITHLIAANYFFKQNKIEEAIGNWKLSLAKNPNLVLALNNLAVILATTNPPDIDQALQLINRALAIEGPNAELFDSKGDILSAAGKRIEAIAEYEKAIKLQPGRFPTREKIVRHLEKEGMTTEAQAHRELIERLRKQLEAHQAAQEAAKNGPANVPLP